MPYFSTFYKSPWQTFFGVPAFRYLSNWIKVASRHLQHSTVEPGNNKLFEKHKMFTIASLIHSTYQEIFAKMKFLGIRNEVYYN